MIEFMQKLHNSTSIKNRLIIVAVLVTLLLFGMSQLILNTLSNIEEKFIEYNTNAVQGKIATLKIEKNLNYISRSTRDIMLGNAFEENIQKIETSREEIVQGFSSLNASATGRAYEEEVRDLMSKSKIVTLAFIDEALYKVKQLHNADTNKRSLMYQQYKTEATPLANESRDYFEKIKTIKDKNFELLKENYNKDIKDQRELITAVTILAAGIFIVFMKFAYNNIVKNLKTQEELEDTEQLLVQYKKAIDLSNIVSKTDTKGTITYVNDEFCSVSQYTREELIGQPHNIIRHNNMSQQAFKDLWSTIKSKQYWKGIVENRKKDGSSYFVDTIIMPIVIRDGSIKEHIAIRKDITELVELNQKISSSQEEILNRIGMIAETRCQETGDHVRRVAEYSKVIAKELGLSQERIDLLSNASALHDIGKVAIADSILNKPGKLTDEEFEEMKLHTTKGYEMLNNSKNRIIQTGAVIAYEHHERFDGTGYPKKKKGEEIDLFARITALADVFDALGSTRAYKKAWDINEIIIYIKKQRGKQFDPQIVDIFLEKIQEFIFIRKKFSSAGERLNF